MLKCFAVKFTGAGVREALQPREPGDIRTLLRNGARWLGLRLLLTARALLSPVALGAAGLVVDAAGRVLLVRHSYKSGWSLPLGGVERGEPPATAVLRELNEEVGLEGGAADFFGLYTRRAGWVTNVVALYRITGARVNFRPNWEIREILWADPANPPPGATPATLRRLAELKGGAISPYW
jgi:8-oxo-dGTP pyrophosphatase MutT (NUDIX family)